MAKQHVNAEKNANSQRALQAAARKKAQAERDSKKFTNGSNKHNGASKGQSGQQSR